MDISIIERVSKKTGNPYQAVQVSIGKWKKLIFVQDFELDYIKSILSVKTDK
jgi:hypothetical protein